MPDSELISQFSTIICYLNKKIWFTCVTRKYTYMITSQLRGHLRLNQYLLVYIQKYWLCASLKQEGRKKKNQQHTSNTIVV